ncbi:MAG: MAPEG family protein [Pseudomonadales bacterium]
MSYPELIISCGLLAFVLIFPPLIAAIQSNGLQWAFGNRNIPADLPEWASRAQRAQRNTVDVLLPFAIILIGVQSAGVPPEQLLFGTALFFWSRVAYAIVYIIGIPYLRTAIFLAGVAGMLSIARTVLPIPNPGALFM